MKTITLTLLVATSLVSLTSCNKESLRKNTRATRNITTTTTPNVYYDEYSSGGCPTTSTPLIAGQHINAGNVSVSNDDTYIYVTYNAENGYVLTETHLFVGDCEAIPVTNSGNPSPGQFPYKNSHDDCTTYTYKVPIAMIPVGSCGCIAAHAALVKYGANGQVVDSQTGWGSGTLINPNGGNWGMKFQYCSCMGGS